MPGPFSRDNIREFLAEHGYTANPEGLIQPFEVNFVHEETGLAYLDVNADAVRKGDEVPERPVRISFQKLFDGSSSRWTLKSVEELMVGVESKALDRHSLTPKISPWPQRPDKRHLA